MTKYINFFKPYILILLINSFHLTLILYYIKSHKRLVYILKLALLHIKADI